MDLTRITVGEIVGKQKDIKYSQIRAVRITCYLHTEKMNCDDTEISQLPIKHH